MTNHEFEDACSDMTQKYTLEIPCVLAERAEAFARETKTSITSVVIEALDYFLRVQSKA